MLLVGTARQMGVTVAGLGDLIAGSAGVGVARRLGTTTRALQDFIDGDRSIGLAVRIGVTAQGLEELRSRIGQQGAIGLLIGLCLGADQMMGQAPAKMGSATHPRK